MNLNRQIHNIDVHRRFCKPLPAVNISFGRFFLVTNPGTAIQDRILRHMIVCTPSRGQVFREWVQVSDSWRIL